MPRPRTVKHFPSDVPNDDSSAQAQQDKLIATLQAKNAELECQLSDYQKQLQQKEQAQQRSEASLNAILNSAIAAITSFRMFPNQTWEYDYISAGCEKVFGFPPQAFIADKTLWISRILPDDQELVATVFQHIFNTEPLVLEYRFLHADGTVRWISETTTSRWDETASCWVVIVISLDVSERKQLEETISRSEAQYRLLFENNPSPMWVFDEETLTFLAVNDAAVEQYGYSKADFLTMTMADICPQADIATLQQSLLSAPGSPSGVYRGIWQHQTWDGSLIDVEISSHPILWEGKPAKFVMAKDITEQQAALQQCEIAETALHQSEQQIRNILTSISDAFFSVNREGQFTFLNQRAEQLLHRRAEQLLGKTIWDMFPEAIDSEFHVQYRWAIEHRQSVTFEEYYPLYDIWLEVRAYPFEEGLSVYLRDISGRKRVELESQRLHERWQFLLANTPAAILTCKPEGDYGTTFMSDNIRSIMGYEPQEFLNDSSFWASHIHPDDAPQVFSGVAPLFEHGYHTHEYRFLHKNGTYHWVRNGLRLIRDGSGTPVEILGYLIDIDDLKRTEETLRESEQRLRTILESSPLPTFIKDLQRRYISVNYAYEQMMQLSREQVLGRSDDEFLPPDFAEICQHSDQAALAAERPVVFEEQVLLPQGLGAFLVTKFRLCNTAGVPYAIGGITIDITERKRAEESLRQSEQFLRSIYNHTQASLFIVDIVDGNFQFVSLNPVHERLTGISTNEVRGKTPEQVFPADVAAEICQHYRDCITIGESITYEERVPFRGREMWWMTTLTPIRDDNFRIVRLIGNCLDITDRVQAEQEQERQRQKSQLVASITLKIRQFLDLDNILQTMVNEVRQWLQCDRVLVYRFEPDWSGTVITEAVSSPNWAILGQTIHDPCFGQHSVRPYQQGRVSTIADLLLANDLQPCHKQLLQRFAVRANLVVPLLQDQHLWGLLIAHQCTTSRYWSTDEIALLQQLASQVSIAIQQADLFRQLQLELTERQRAEVALQHLNQQLEQRVEQRTQALQQQVEKEQLLLTVTQRIRESLDLNDILQRTVDEIRRVLQTDRVVVFRFNPDWSGNFIAESVGDGWTKLINNNVQLVCEDTYLQETEGGRYRNHETLAIEDIYTVGHMPCHIELLEQFQARAYAIAPIFSGEELWGLLGIYQNTSPRNWQSWEIELLQQTAIQLAVGIQQSALYQQIQTELAERQQAEVQLQEAQRVAHVGSWEFDLATQKITWSAETFRIFRRHPDQQEPTYEELQLYHPSTDRELLKRAATKTIQIGEPYELDLRIIREDSSMGWIFAKGQPRFNRQGQVIQLFGTVLDITERKRAEEQLRASLKEKEVLLREIHHRVKNNMQLVSSLLNLQASAITDPTVLELFHESQRRVKVMALIHERLYRSDNLAQINFATYIQDLAQDVFQSYKTSPANIDLNIDVAPLELNIDIAILCGLIISELISNALKYAFPNNNSGEINISFDVDKTGNCILMVSDNGVGIPPDLDPQNTNTLGLQLVYGLIEQLGGKVELCREAGSHFTMIFSR